MLLDAALVFGTLSSLLGLSELLLRDHQRDFVSRRIDGLTLQLDYTRPLRWFNSLQEPSPVVPFLVFLSVVISYVILDGNLAHLPDPLSILLFIVSVIAISILAPSLVLWRRSKDILRFLQGNVSLWSLAYRTVRLGTQSLWQGILLGVPTFLITTLLGLALLRLLTFALLAAGVNVSTSHAELIANVLFPVVSAVTANFLYTRSPHRFLLWQLGMPIVLSVITLATLMALLEFLLKFMRGLLWRIAEFQKGPVAALTLLLTAILAILRLYLYP